MGLKPSGTSIARPGEARLLPRGSLLIAGIPATGKSTFGDWLEGQQSYLHLDFDEEDRVAQRGFGTEQQLLWHHQQGEPLRQALLARHQPIVITWGFAPQFLPTVRHIVTWGLVPVWFTAMPAVARQAFIARGGIDVRFFDQYLALLAPHEAELMTIFGSHSVRPLSDDGARLACSTIYQDVTAWLE